MTRSLIARRAFGVLLTGLALALTACGGNDDSGDSGGNANMRVVNATTDLASIDVYTNTDKRYPAVVPDQVTDSQSLNANTYTVKVTSAGSETTLFSANYSLSGGNHYTGIVWGNNGSLHFATLPEDENTADITTGASRMRVYNATSGVGAFDVYLTQGVDNLANADPTIGSAAAGTLTAFRELATGSYRLRITAAGDKSKVRLDIPDLTLTEKKFSTLLITAGTGALVNGALIIQQGDYTPLRNGYARVRVIPGADNNGRVSVQYGDVTLATNAVSPPPVVVAAYTQVIAGVPATLNVQVDGSSVSSTQQTLTAGADYSLLVYGNGLTSLIADDNRLPGTGTYKLRLVNATGGADPLTLTVAYAPVIADLPAGSGSTYYSFVPPSNGAATSLVVSSASSQVALTLEPILSAAGVYSLFAVGGDLVPKLMLVKEP